MVKITYKESQFRFTDPIRYFKANDPIYWEVENIPLKQIHENTLWLKDQMVSDRPITISDVDRSSFSELKPYVEGTDNVVKVKPGRFTARINDAYNLNKLQFIQSLFGSEMTDYNSWFASTIAQPAIQDILNRFQSQAFNMNGLAERVFSYPARDPDTASQFRGQTTPTVVTLTGLNKSPYPMTEAQLWGGTVNSGFTYLIRQYNEGTPSIGFAALGIAETAFVKRWRGVARTAVVDVSEELEIEIPRFDEQDFYYIDSNGEKRLLNATQRIDLVFIYTKPIDSNSTTLAKFVGDLPASITKPMLGIVYGAGIGLDFSDLGSQDNKTIGVISTRRPDGSVRILPCLADELDTNSGFMASGIRGSFPSPDDIMNLTPLLDEKMSDTDFSLIGQSVLPVAYVVVRKTATTNEAGMHVITENDLVDIRPFFRTTELSYNERAGIAAAVPAPSLANPVVTQAELDYEVKRSYFDLLSRIRQEQQTAATEKPRVVGAGYVKGGFNYGVEGVLCDYIRKKVLTGSRATSPMLLMGELKNRYNLPTALQIPDYPDWDIAPWVGLNNLPQAGLHLNDRIHVFQVGNPLGGRNWATRPTVEFGSYESSPDIIPAGAPLTTTYVPPRIQKFGTDSLYDQDGHVSMLYCKKTIYLNRGLVPWMEDYQVDVQLWNCAPLTCRATSRANETMAGAANIWVDKKYDSFTIYVSWVANDYANAYDHTDRVRPSGQTNNQIDLTKTRDGRWYSGFAVITEDIANASPSQKVFTGESNGGVTTYPTVSFKIVGYPANFGGLAYNLNAASPTLTLA